jgi:hypothetical protein
MLLAVCLLYSACTKPQEQNAPETDVEAAPKEEIQNFSGNYVSNGYSKRMNGYDWVAMVVEHKDDFVEFKVRSRADNKKPTCLYDGKANRTGGSIFNTYVDGNPVSLKFRGDSLIVEALDEEGERALFFYCSGGATFAGAYQKIEGSLDPEQMDNTEFSKVLRLQGIGFNVNGKKEGSTTMLTILPFGLEGNSEVISHEIKGKIVDAEVEDLNSDGSPELVVFTFSDEDNRGDLIAYSVNNKKSMIMIYFPPISENNQINQGYDGKDEFTLIETSLSRRFPVVGTNTMRQVIYKMVDGEASPRFTVVSTAEFEKN